MPSIPFVVRSSMSPLKLVAVFADAFDLRVDLLAEQAEVNNLILHIINMGWTVMAVNTIHRTSLRLLALRHVDIFLSA